MATSGNAAETLTASQTKLSLGAGVRPATAVVGGSAPVTQIGVEAVFRGDLKSKSDVVVAGAVEGEVASDARVVIVVGGSVTGRVVALEVVIEGRLVGDSLATKSLAIMSTAEVRGDVSTPVITIEPGAVFVGRCTMTEQVGKE